MGLPFAYLAKHVFNLFIDDDDDWEELMRRHTPKWAARAAFRGIPSALLGNDMSWRVQGTDVLGVPIGFQVAGMAQKRAAQARKMWGQGEFLDAVFHLTPDMVRNPYRAYLGYAEGGERKGVPPIHYSFQEAVTKFLGFTPTREAEAWKVQEITRKKKEARLDKLGDFAERWIKARKQNDPRMMRELKRDVAEYNRKQREKGLKGIKIPWKTVVQSAKRRRKGRERGYLENIPKYMEKFSRETQESFGLTEK